MWTPFWAILSYAQIWLAVPLVFAFALVYSATRHEDMRFILRHGFRTAAWLLSALAVLYFLLWLFV